MSYFSLSYRWQRKWGVAHRCCQMQSLSRLFSQNPEAMTNLRGTVHSKGLCDTWVMFLLFEQMSKHGCMAFCIDIFSPHRPHNTLYWPIGYECLRPCYAGNNGCASSVDKGNSCFTLHLKKKNLFLVSPIFWPEIFFLSMCSVIHVAPCCLVCADLREIA